MSIQYPRCPSCQLRWPFLSVMDFIPEKIQETCTDKNTADELIELTLRYGNQSTISRIGFILKRRTGIPLLVVNISRRLPCRQSLSEKLMQRKCEQHSAGENPLFGISLICFMPTLHWISTSQQRFFCTWSGKSSRFLVMIQLMYHRHERNKFSGSLPKK
jgi:hypothetical protein